MDFGSIIERLRGAPGFKIVAGAADLAAAYAAPMPAAPAAYVVRLGESASPNALSGDVEHQVTVRFAVVIAARNVADTTGVSAGFDIDALRIVVRDLLLGWLPTGAIAPCEYLRGALGEFDAGLMWWQDEFQTDYYVRSY